MASWSCLESYGKRDILIRLEHSNVFIAECKFWAGAQRVRETIDQILDYLTWRDSKAAILFFVNRKEISPVLDQIVKAVSNHECFVKFRGKKCDSWFDFDFHLKTDTSRGVRLAVLCFHFPRTSDDEDTSRLKAERIQTRGTPNRPKRLKRNKPT